MTELDELEEIAEAAAFGFRGLARPGAPRRGRKPPSETCGAGHPWTAGSTRYYRVGKRIRRVCRICDKLRARARACARNAESTA